MHFMDLAAMIGITAALGTVAYVKFFKKYKATGDGIDDTQKYSLDYLLDGVRDTFDAI